MPEGEAFEYLDAYHEINKPKPDKPGKKYIVKKDVKGKK